MKTDIQLARMVGSLGLRADHAIEASAAISKATSEFDPATIEVGSTFSVNINVGGWEEVDDVVGMNNALTTLGLALINIEDALDRTFEYDVEKEIN